jgi:hypothetical protein
VNKRCNSIFCCGDFSAIGPRHTTSRDRARSPASGKPALEHGGGGGGGEALLNVYPVDEERYRVSLLLRIVSMKSNNVVDPDPDLNRIRIQEDPKNI